MLQGRYKAKNTDNIWDSYCILMDVKETEKSYIFCLVDFQTRYGAGHIERLFSKSKRIVIQKKRGGHVIRKWTDGTFHFICIRQAYRSTLNTQKRSRRSKRSTRKRQ